jgi:hypothetical protein
MTQQVIYKFVGFQSPIPGSKYNIGRTIPVKFIITDFADNPVGTAKADIWTRVNAGALVWYGRAVYSGLHYAFNLDTSLLPNSTQPGDSLAIWVYLDDGTQNPAPLVTLK